MILNLKVKLIKIIWSFFIVIKKFVFFKDKTDDETFEASLGHPYSRQFQQYGLGK